MDFSPKPQNPYKYEIKLKSQKVLEDPRIELGASHMLSERSTIWARPPILRVLPLNEHLNRGRTGRSWNLRKSADMKSKLTKL